MSHFAKRHYEAIALVLQDAYMSTPNKGATNTQVTSIVNLFADMFSRDNGLFKRDRFERACEPGANVRARTK